MASPSSWSVSNSNGRFTLTLNISESTNTAGNYSTISYSLVLKANTAYNFEQYRIGRSVTINGSTVYSVAKANAEQFSIADYGSITVASGSTTVYHNGDGSKSMAVAFSIDMNSASYTPGPLSGSGSSTLTQIPRYTSITSYSVWAVDETSLYISYSTADYCDAQCYRINGGSWISMSSGGGQVNGLSAGTYYEVEIAVRRADSQLYTYSSKYGVTMYSYPYCNASPNFTIGNDVTLSLYNPLSRSVAVSILNASGTTILTGWGTTGTSVTVSATDVVKNALYASIPNAQSGKYQVKVVFGSAVNTRNNGNTYSINVSECTPTVSGTVVDTNATTKALTGDNKKLIKYNSTAVATVTSTAKNHATIASNSVNALSGSTVTFTNVETSTFTFTTKDSRGIQNSCVVSPTIIDYVKLTNTSTAKRITPTGDQVNVNFSGNYFNNSFGAQSNSIVCKYRIKEEYGEFGEYVTITPTLNGNTYSCSTVVSGVAYNKNYIMESIVTDKLMSKTADIKIEHGIPVFDWGKNDFNFNVPVTVQGNPVIFPYPIGSIYISTESTSPANLFGGTWEQTCKGRFLFGAGVTESNTTSTYGDYDAGINWGAGGQRFGERSHTLSIAEMPFHDGHSDEWGGNYCGYMSSGYLTAYGGQGRGWSVHAGNELIPAFSGRGGDSVSYNSNVAHNNVPQAESYYIWKRIG